MWRGVRCPANMRRRYNVVLLLGQRRRRWPNNKPTLDECLGFQGSEGLGEVDGAHAVGRSAV